MNAEQAPPEQPKAPTSDQAESIRADDALVDRLSAGRWDRRDRRDPAAAVLAAVLAELDDRPDPRAVARRHGRRGAMAVPVIAGLVVMPGLAAAASVGDPWAPYRSALTAVGLAPTPPAADSGQPSPAAASAQPDFAAAASRALSAAEEAAAAGDLVGAQRLLAAANESLVGAAGPEAALLWGRFWALERVLAKNANGTPGGPVATESPAPNGNAAGQEEGTQANPPSKEPPAPGGVNGAGNGGPSTAGAPTPSGNANGWSDTKQTGRPAG